MNAAGLEQVLAFFTRPQGRIGRAEFSLGALLIYALGCAILAFVVTRTDAGAGVSLLAFLITLPLTVGFLVIAAKRCHDLALPGSFLLLLFVPFLGLFWLVALCVFPGSQGPNAYGAAPRFRAE